MPNRPESRRGWFRTELVSFTCLLILSIACALAGNPPEKRYTTTAPTTRPSWHIDDPNAFLASRLRTGAMLGTFNGYCSLLYATRNVAIHTNDPKINQTRLWSPFPSDYAPTWAELFEAIARRTGSSFAFDANTHYWVFSKPPLPLPYSVKLAKGWKQDPRGEYVAYIPTIAPVGMDIYLCGRFSAKKDKKKDKAKLFTHVREELARRFARYFKKKVDVKDMTKVQVAGAEALYFQSPSPKRPTITWRQWVFVKDGHGIAIVSAIDQKNQEKLLPDVRAMVGSFRITAAASTGARTRPSRR